MQPLEPEFKFFLSQFHYDSATQILSAEASDLGFRVGEFPLLFWIESSETGREVRFEYLQNRVARYDGDTRWECVEWVYRPAANELPCNVSAVRICHD